MKFKVSTLSIGFLSLVMLFSANAVTPAERQYLIDFYNSTDGDNWTNTQAGTNVWDINNPGSDPCTWYGITCDINSNIERLSLAANNLVGTIPSNLTDLAVLESFSAGSNQLSGQIPNLPSNLRDLLIDRNQLEGSIPTLPSSLEYFYAFENNLSGNLPAMPAGLYALRVANNQLTGPIPSATVELDAAQDSSLCPNYFDRVDDPAWDTITGETPWHQQCTDAPAPATKVQKIPSLNIWMLLAGLALLATISAGVMRKR